MSDYMSGRGRVGDGFGSVYTEEMKRRNPLFNLFGGGPDTERPGPEDLGGGETTPQEGILGYRAEAPQQPTGRGTSPSISKATGWT